MKPIELKENGIYYRHPKTTQEKRKFYDCPEEVKIRGKRKPRHLIDAWEDKWVEKSISKSWKNKRKTQYREKKQYQKLFIKNAPYGIVDFLEKHNISYTKNKTEKWFSLFFDITCYLEEKQIKAVQLEIERIFNTFLNSRLRSICEYFVEERENFLKNP